MKPDISPKLTLRIKNIRSFAVETTANFRRLTLVVGENSAGKSTLLASLYSALSQNYPVGLDFNSEPFDFGPFDSIATNTGGARKKSDSFELGCLTFEKNNSSFLQHATYVDNNGQPRLRNLRISRGDLSVELEIEESQKTTTIIKDGEKAIKHEGQFGFSTPVPAVLGMSKLFELLGPIVGLTTPVANQAPPLEEHRVLGNKANGLIAHTLISKPSVVAISPLRMRPKRIYEIFRATYDTEGSHVPYLLSKLLDDVSESAKKVIKNIELFGAHSGMFKRVQAVKLGKSKGAPFEIRVVGPKGPGFALPDVGYGISQSMPIVTQLQLSPDGTWTLIQQPEVHLHPRAQASLGSALVSSLVGNDKKVVVETHSDYIVDRVRMHVAKGEFSPDDVAILFLEKVGTTTRIHHIEIDSAGNVIGAPESYRKFFFDEADKILGR